MIRRRKLTAAFASAIAAVTLLGLAALPVASADTCTVTVVSRASGQVTNTFPGVDVPAGVTSQSGLAGALESAGLLSSAELDPGVVQISDACAPATTTTTTTTLPSTSTGTSSPTSTSTSTSTPTTTAPSTSSTSTTGTGSTTSSTTTTRTTTTHSTPTTSSTSSTTRSTTSTAARPGSPSAEQPSSRTTATQTTSGSHAKHPKRRSAPTGTTITSTTPTTPATEFPSGNGQGNPAFSLSLPGASPVGVPNFFIQSFQIPPFLIPIYQAAGIEYQVPWQVLAAINEIETDYGRNLSVSSAGAVGWMQFMPATWKQWGVDANGDGVADPYNPVDAIFAAARYLHAAGASQSISRAIFAYNHAGWYVQSVLLYAKLIAGTPSQLIGALTGLVQGHFPVAAPARYADDSVVSLARHKVTGSNAALTIGSDPSAKGTAIFARKRSPVIAVNDGRIVRLGHSRQLGNYVALQDATGNTYTYAHLGSVSRTFASPKPVKLTAKDVAREMATPKVTAPRTAASAGAQVLRQAATSSRTPTTNTTPTRTGRTSIKTTPTRSVASTATTAAPLVKERLFAHPARRASYAAGGKRQLKNAGRPISSFDNYFSDTLHLARDQYTLKRLRVGSIVIAGTVLGRIGGPSQGASSHVYFTIQPAGRKAPDIDPKPILDGWKLLQATAVYRANRVDPFYGPGAKNPSTGQVLLMSKQQLTERVLTDPHVRIYNCGRRDIQAGTIDRRVLAVIEFLSASGLDPTVSGLACDHSVNGTTGVDAAGATGESVDISQINGVPIGGHQGAGSVTDLAIRRLLTLQGSMAPNYIVSDMAYKGQSRTLALPDHKNRIQVSFTPAYGNNHKLSAQLTTALKAGQWAKLIARISRIPEPVVPISPSKYAIREPRH